MIDSNETMSYMNGKDIEYVEGFDDCKTELMEVIRSLAWRIAQYQYPNVYDFDDKTLENIMVDAGLNQRIFGGMKYGRKLYERI